MNLQIAIYSVLGACAAIIILVGLTSSLPFLLSLPIALSMAIGGAIFLRFNKRIALRHLIRGFLAASIFLALVTSGPLMRSFNMISGDCVFADCTVGPFKYKDRHCGWKVYIFDVLVMDTASGIVGCM